MAGTVEKLKATHAGSGAFSAADLLGDIATSISDFANEIKGDTSRPNLVTPVSGIKFPDDLIDSQEAIRFEIFENYQFDRTENKSEGKSAATIYLPIPNVLQPSYSADYQETELGVFGRAGASMVGGQGNDNTAIQDFTGGALNLLAQGISGAGAIGGGLLGEQLGKIGESGGKLSSLLQKVGAGAGAIGAEGAKGAMFGMGVARNPHMAQVFKNIKFRSHSFDYKFSPKNVPEQETLTKIIRLFKLAMHPKYMFGDHMFSYPAQFDIDIISGQSNKHFYNIGVSVLTDMSVNYLPNGPHMHEIAGGYENTETTKAPVAVNMSLKFTEIKIVTQQEIVENNY
jgi:hypothetical protein